MLVQVVASSDVQGEIAGVGTIDSGSRMTSTLAGLGIRLRIRTGVGLEMAHAMVARGACPLSASHTKQAASYIPQKLAVR